VTASAVINAAGNDDQRAALIPDLADGKYGWDRMGGECAHRRRQGFGVGTGRNSAAG